MPAYTFSNLNAGSQQALSTAYKTIVGINAATGATTLRRGWIMEWEIGADAAPAATDCPIAWSIDVMTAAGTGSALTPQVNDIGGADAAALLVYTANYTAEPTVTANSNLWYLPLNQRASYRIQMRDEWSSIIVPAVNLKGPVMRAKAPVASSYTGTVGWRGLIRE
jgi:hypothetical protein